MAISFVAKGTEDATENVGVATINPDVPSGIQADDILIIGAIEGSTDQTISFPSGFTEGDQGGVTGAVFAWAYKRADGTESGTLPVTRASGDRSQFMAVIFAMRGVRTTGDPFDGKFAIYRTASTTSISSEIITSGTNRRVLVWMMCENDHETVSMPNYTREFDVLSTVGNDSEAVLFFQDVATASTVDAETTAERAGSQRSGTWTFDLVPAVAAAGSLLLMNRSIANFGGTR